MYRDDFERLIGLTERGGARGMNLSRLGGGFEHLRGFTEAEEEWERG